VAEALLAAGYECHLAHSPAQALEHAPRIAPDLIVSDINLDGESGLELCRQIKELPDLASVPVMFLSGAPIPDIVQQAHAAGGTYYLRKPFDPTVLIDLVEKALWMPHLVAART